MEEFILKEEIAIACFTATSFPEGVLDAFQQLDSKVSDPQIRRHFAISNPVNGKIVYKAAFEERFSGESASLGLEGFLIPAGVYLREIVPDFMNNIASIGTAFQSLLQDPRLDWDFPCLEWYQDSDTVWCMVKIKI